MGCREEVGIEYGTIRIDFEYLAATYESECYLWQLLIVYILNLYAWFLLLQNDR